MKKTVPADENPYSSKNQGEDVDDRVFILSIKEAEKYFSSDESRIATYKGQDSWWHLRSTGDNVATYVDTKGDISNGGGYKAERGVRPAMWILIEN